MEEAFKNLRKNDDKHSNQKYPRAHKDYNRAKLFPHASQEIESSIQDDDFPHKPNLVFKNVNSAIMHQIFEPRVLKPSIYISSVIQTPTTVKDIFHKSIKDIEWFIDVIYSCRWLNPFKSAFFCFKQIRFCKKIKMGKIKRSSDVLSTSAELFICF